MKGAAARWNDLVSMPMDQLIDCLEDVPAGTALSQPYYLQLLVEVGWSSFLASDVTAIRSQILAQACDVPFSRLIPGLGNFFWGELSVASHDTLNFGTVGALLGLPSLFLAGH